MSSNTNIGNTPVNQGYVQLIHTGETGGIDGTLRTLYDGDGTAADLLIASDKVKVSTELFIGAKTLTEFIQDTVGTMFTTGNSLTNVSVTYDDANNNIDLNATGEVTLTGSQTLTNKTLTSPVINTSVSGTAILDEDNMSSNSDSKLATQQSIKAYVDAEVSSLVSSAPTALDTLDELAAALGDDANFATTTATSLGEKLVKASNLSDLTNTTTARSNLGLGSLAELSSISVSNLTASAIQTSGESFADNDTSLMTSAAIQDKIESFGFTTNTGDMTGVSITASNPLDISQSNTTSGSYSATISLVASEFGGYLADMTDLVVGATDELAVLDNGTLKRKQIDEIRLTAFDATGFSSGISFNGSTANGLLTFGNSTTADVESGLTYGGSALNLTGNLNISGYIYDSVNSGNRLDLDDDSDSGQGNQVALYGINHLNLVADNTNNGTGEIRFWNGAVSDLDSGTNTRLMTIDNSGNVTFNAGDVKLGATKKLFFDGGSHTYIQESSADILDFYVGGVRLMQMREESVDKVRFPDDVRITAGNGDDFQIFHNATDTFVKNNTGDFYISNDADDKDLILRSDDGSGGQTAYLTLDGSAESIEISKKMQFPASHSADKIVMYSGGNEKIGTEANTLLFTGANHVFHDTSNNDIMKISTSGVEINGGAGTDLDPLLRVQKKVDGNGSATGILLGAVAGGQSKAGIFFENLGVGNGRGSLYFCNENTSDSSDATIADAKMTITRDGNVGIGTTSPDTLLHVDEDDSATAFKVTGGSGGNKIASFIRDEGVSSPHAEVYIHAGSGDPQITFRDVGNEYFSIGLDDSANSFKISDNTGVGTNDRLTIDSSGDIKIEESLGIGVSASGTTGRLDCSNDVVAFASSDKRLKENIKPLDNALDKINKINGVEFDWKELSEEEKKTIHGNEGHDVGVIAQEIEEVLPEVVQTRDNGYKAVKYEKIVPLLIEAIKELKQEIEDLK